MSSLAEDEDEYAMAHQTSFGSPTAQRKSLGLSRRREMVRGGFWHKNGHIPVIYIQNIFGF